MDLNDAINLAKGIYDKSTDEADVCKQVISNEELFDNICDYAILLYFKAKNVNEDNRMETIDYTMKFIMENETKTYFKKAVKEFFSIEEDNKIEGLAMGLLKAYIKEMVDSKKGL